MTAKLKIADLLAAAAAVLLLVASLLGQFGGTGAPNAWSGLALNELIVTDLLGILTAAVSIAAGLGRLPDRYPWAAWAAAAATVVLLSSVFDAITFSRTLVYFARLLQGASPGLGAGAYLAIAAAVVLWISVALPGAVSFLGLPVVRPATSADGRAPTTVAGGPYPDVPFGVPSGGAPGGPSTGGLPPGFGQPGSVPVPGAPGAQAPGAQAASGQASADASTTPPPPPPPPPAGTAPVRPADDTAAQPGPAGTTTTAPPADDTAAQPGPAGTTTTAPPGVGTTAPPAAATPVPGPPAGPAPVEPTTGWAPQPQPEAYRAAPAPAAEPTPEAYRAGIEPQPEAYRAGTAPKAEPAPEAYRAEPAPAVAAVTGAAAGAFTPFWAAVPTPRPIYRADDPSAVAAMLQPGTWYAAVAPHAHGIVVQLASGETGVLVEVADLFRG